MDHPERFEAFVVCGAARKPAGAYGSVEIRTDQCIAPPSAAGASNVGKGCSQALSLGERAHQLTFGGDECASEVCLSTPLGMLTCTEQGGVGRCGDKTTRCSWDGRVFP